MISVQRSIFFDLRRPRPEPDSYLPSRPASRVIGSAAASAGAEIVCRVVEVTDGRSQTSGAIRVARRAGPCWRSLSGAGQGNVAYRTPLSAKAKPVALRIIFCTSH
jgi:hypothetical protein